MKKQNETDSPSRILTHSPNKLLGLHRSPSRNQAPNPSRQKFLLAIRTKDHNHDNIRFLNQDNVLTPSENGLVNTGTTSRAIKRQYQTSFTPNKLNISSLLSPGGKEFKRSKTRIDGLPKPYYLSDESTNQKKTPIRQKSNSESRDTSQQNLVNLDHLPTIRRQTFTLTQTSLA